jgi:hypothetical protein
MTSPAAKPAAAHVVLPMAVVMSQSIPPGCYGRCGSSSVYLLKGIGQ